MLEYLGPGLILELKLQTSLMPVLLSHYETSGKVLFIHQSHYGK